MMKYIFLIIIFIILVFYYSSYNRNKTISENYIHVSNLSIKKSKNARIVIERWGELGHSIYTVENGIKHGKWLAYENKKIRISGEYFNGEKYDVWIWYNRDGDEIKQVHYNSLSVD